MDEETKQKVIVTLPGTIVVDASFAPMLLDMMASADKFKSEGYGSTETVSISPLEPRDGLNITSISNTLYQTAKMAGKPE